MTTLAKSIEAKIRTEHARFAGLALPPEFVAPNYGGRSIVNLATSVAWCLGLLVVCGAIAVRMQRQTP